MSNEEDLIERLRVAPGDQDLWSQWYKSVFPRIFYIAFRLSSGNRELARDLAQESFARFIDYRVLERVLDERHAMAFLARTCRNLVIDEFGRANLVNYISSEELEGLMAEDDESSAYEWDWQAIESSIDHKELQLLQWLREGHKLADIATRLGISYTAAGVRVHRLKQQLRQFYFAPV